MLLGGYRRLHVAPESAGIVASPNLDRLGCGRLNENLSMFQIELSIKYFLTQAAVRSGLDLCFVYFCYSDSQPGVVPQEELLQLPGGT